MTDKLKIYKQGALLQEIPLAPGPLTLGRHKDVDIQLEDIQLSRFHAEISKSGDGYFLTDRKSLNGTILNGRKLKPEVPVAIRNGSIASISPFELHFELEEKSAPVEAPAPEPASSAVFDRAPDEGLLLAHLIEQREQVPVWTKGKTTLQVADIIEETSDVKTFRMVGVEPILFSYLPGQFMTLRLDIDGKAIKRSYTISSSPSRPHTVEITVKRVPGGLVSNWLCDNVKLGDRIEVQGPAGKFSCFKYPSQKILCIGAGSGMTPVMSMCRWIVDTTADVDVRLLGCFRSPSDIIFRRELDVMASRHSAFKVAVAVTGGAGPEPWTGLTGHVDKHMLQLVCPDLHERHIFMCGPQGFMDCVKDCLKELDFPLSQLHTESFGAGRVAKNVKVEPRDVRKKVVPDVLAPPDCAPPESMHASSAGSVAASAPTADGPAESVTDAGGAGGASDAGSAGGQGFKVHFVNSGKEVVTDGSADLLELAEVNGIEIDYSCRSGSCLTCQVRCRSGKVDMEDGQLDDDEVAEGWILPCVAFPCSDVEVEA